MLHVTNNKISGLLSFNLKNIIINPINPSKFLLWIAGISGIGTQAAARFVRDLVLKPKTTFDEWEINIQDNPNIAVVKPSLQGDRKIQHYIKGNWRISDYEVIWSGRYD